MNKIAETCKSKNNAKTKVNQSFHSNANHGKYSALIKLRLVLNLNRYICI